MELSEKIREIRNLKKLKQEDLANACNVTRSAISNWEAGRRRPDWDNLVVLARLFGITIEELVGDELIYYENPEPSSTTKKGKKLSYVVPIINTVVTIIVIIILLVFLLTKSKNNKNNYFSTDIINSTDQIALRINDYNNSAESYQFDFHKVINSSTLEPEYHINHLVLSEEHFTKYSYSYSKIAILNIMITSSYKEPILLNTKKYCRIDDTNNKVELHSKYNIPYISELGCYNIVLRVSNDTFLIGAFLCNETQN